MYKCILILLIFCSNSCRHNTSCPILSHVQYRDIDADIHSCPEPGHGVCYVCNDPLLINNNEITKK